MIKTILVFLSLITLIACTNSPDLRPDVYINADSLLQSGINAYKEDRYPVAIQHFNRAMTFYESVDDEHGVIKARLNLANTALAYSDFKAAKTQIENLKQQSTKGLLAASLTQRLIFLQTKFYFAQQDYANALDTIKPLLEQPPFSLKLLATMARLEALNSRATETLWLNKFQQALAKLELKNIKQQMVLNRILAHYAVKEEDYNQAEILLNTALNYYKKQASRRAIADCLEQLAEIAQLKNNLSKAREQWNKALKIRLWLKDEYKAEYIRKQLLKIPVKI